MKKLYTLTAMILIAALLPVSALAAPTDAVVIQLSDPVITVDGEHATTLEGLILQLAVCASDDGSLTQLIFDLFTGGRSTSSAMLQIDDSAVVAYLGGMTSAYSISADDISSSLGMDQLEELAASMENWSLPGDIEAVVDAHMDDFTVSEPYLDADSGLEYVDISGDMTAALVDVLALIENDPFTGELLAMFDADGALDGLSRELAESGYTFGLEGSFGANSAGDIIDYSMILSCAENGELLGEYSIDMDIDATVPSNVRVTESLRMTDGSGAELMNMDISMSIGESGFTLACEGFTDEETVSIHAAGSFSDVLDVVTASMDTTSPYSEQNSIDIIYTNLKSDRGMEAALRITGGEGADRTQIDISLVTDETDAGMAVDARLTATYDDTSAWFDLHADSDYATGACSASLTVGDGVTEPVSIAAGYTPTAAPEGVDSSAIVDITLNDGYTELVISSTLNVLTVQADTDSFYIDPAAAIDLMTISDVDMETAVSELEAVLDHIGNALENTYPDIF